jgi:hypothetical protein
MMYSLVVLGGAVGFTAAEDKADPKAKPAKLTKLDAKKGTATVTMKADGKDVERTFKLADDIEYMDSTGKVATADIFTSGDTVVLVESEGQICKMRKNAKPVAAAGTKDK